MTASPQGARRNHRGELIDLYGVATIYEGDAENREERYLVWYGHRSDSGASYTGVRTTFHSLRRAIRESRRWQAKGYDVKITDRLIEEKTQ